MWEIGRPPKPATGPLAVEVQNKKTRPPPRYNEGTLVDAMQNAWCFLDDEALRSRLREARGIGTPATRAEVIRGLKAQEFLVAAGRHIVPTGRGLELFAVLERADPALVDPGVTAQLECLLDEVLVGRQEMMGAIDAVCAQAQRIVGRLTSHAGEGRKAAASLGGGGGLGVAAAEWIMRQNPMLMGYASLPVHQLALAVHGVHLVENMKLDALARRGPHEFAFAVQPLKMIWAPINHVSPAQRGARSPLVVGCRLAKLSGCCLGLCSALPSMPIARPLFSGAVRPALRAKSYQGRKTVPRFAARPSSS